MIDERQAVEASTLEKTAELVLASAKRCGADSVEIHASKSKGFSTQARLGKMERFEYHQQQGFEVTIYVGQHKGSASSADFGEDAIDATVKSACHIAKYTSEDPFNGLADPTRLAGAELLQKAKDLDLYHPWGIDEKQAIDMAMECEQIALQYDGQVSNSEGAEVESYEGVRIYANSHGFMGRSSGTQHAISCSVVSGQGDAMQRDGWYSIARHAQALDDIKTIAEKAAQRAVRRLEPKSLATGQMPVLFSAEMARSLISNLVSALSGRSQYRKASFLLDAKNQQVFPDFFQLRESPFLPRGLGSRLFDAEGVAAYERDIVKNGMILDYFLSSYSARKLNLSSTASAGGCANLQVESTGESFEALLKKMDKGLLVTELAGQGSNLITGDYSRGASGFWVKNGLIQYPVEELTIAGRLQDMYANIVGIACDVDVRNSIQMGSMLIDSMTVASGTSSIS